MTIPAWRRRKGPTGRRRAAGAGGGVSAGRSGAWTSVTVATLARLHRDPACSYRHEQQWGGGTRQELVDRLAGALPGRVVVGDHDAARADPVVEVLELVAGRLVPVRVEAQQRDRLGRLAGDRRLDRPDVVVEALRRIAGLGHARLHVLEARLGPHARRARAALEQR